MFAPKDSAWYVAEKDVFVSTSTDVISNNISLTAARQGWSYTPEQKIEWSESIKIIHDLLRNNSDLNFVTGVIAEYNLKRCGLRIDFVLTGPGAVYLIEFKRGKLTSEDRDQVMRYASCIQEFHAYTQATEPMIYPVLVTRTAKVPTNEIKGFFKSWPNIPLKPIECSADGLKEALVHCNSKAYRKSKTVDTKKWCESDFNPSTQIIDAAVTLWGQHDVSAINKHTSTIKDIEACSKSVIDAVIDATNANRKEIVIITGTPGSGKTLAGLQINFSQQLAGEAVFVTGNAPLVEVLNAALSRSYRNTGKKGRMINGYTKDETKFVEKNTDFKIIKAHNFLSTDSTDGRVVIFDEAQRTLAKGVTVNNVALLDNEADLILARLQSRYTNKKPVLILLIGHKQNINDTELGVPIWIEAAIRHGWHYSLCEETANLTEFKSITELKQTKLYRPIANTHLKGDLRNKYSQWAEHALGGESKGQVPGGDSKSAKQYSLEKLLPAERVKITRDLYLAKYYLKECLGRPAESKGIICSGNADRLRAEGLFIREKPPLAPWILCPTDDVRSSNMLEQVQNQFNIQGLELDHILMCWDIDLRREDSKWSCHDIVGSSWIRRDHLERELESRINSYRVLLTRSRTSLTIYVPKGDLTGEDITRPSKDYDLVYNYLISCGAEPIASSLLS